MAIHKKYKGTKVIILFAATQEIIYLEYLLSILADKHEKISSIVLCILEGNTHSSRTFLWRKGERREKISRIEMTMLNFRSSFPIEASTVYLNAKATKRPEKLTRLLDLKPINEILYNSVRSVLATSQTHTYLRDYSIKKLRNRVYSLHSDFENSQKMIISSGLLEQSNECTFIFLNGRHPEQASIRLELEARGLHFLAFEWGEPMGERFHLEVFQVQELLNLQDVWILDRAEFSSKQRKLAISWSQKWLLEQSSSITKNRFLTSGKASSFSDHKIQSKTAVIFTSSLEEDIYNLGEDTNGWESQEHAVIASAKLLSKDSYSVLVRIHPNAANKSWVDLISLVKNLEMEKINYVLPWDPVSSYQLIEEASIVGTWVSRIGIEAAARGVPAFTMGISPYSIAAGILCVGPKNLEKILELETHKIVKEEILLTIYQMHNFGIEIDKYAESDFISRNRENELLVVSNLNFTEKIFLFTSKIRKRIINIFPPLFGLFAYPNAVDAYLWILGDKLCARTKSFFLRVLIKLDFTL